MWTRTQEPLESEENLHWHCGWLERVSLLQRAYIRSEMYTDFPSEIPSYKNPCIDQMLGINTTLTSPVQRR